MDIVLSQSDDKRILHCWKEIATYMSAGVRTVQRWESDFNLPVRRPRGAKRSAVLAFASEIDAWIRALPAAQRASANFNMDDARQGQTVGLSQSLRSSIAVLPSGECRGLVQAGSRSVSAM
jgi:predicted DNA-binding transcriptional regulator AlpA